MARRAGPVMAAAGALTPGHTGALCAPHIAEIKTLGPPTGSTGNVHLSLRSGVLIPISTDCLNVCNGGRRGQRFFWWADRLAPGERNGPSNSPTPDEDSQRGK